MKFTTLHINAVIICVVLALLQGFILWEINGNLEQYFATGRVDVLGMIFSPTAGIVWALKHFAQKGDD